MAGARRIVPNSWMIMVSGVVTVADPFESSAVHAKTILFTGAIVVWFAGSPIDVGSPGVTVVPGLYVVPMQLVNAHGKTVFVARTAG